MDSDVDRHSASFFDSDFEITVGEAIASILADVGVTTMFGIVSVHNMPILDAVARQQRIRFITARGEAGALNMADGYARVSRSIGVALTSTGTAAGNAAGAQMEALVAGSPVLHITSQVDREFVDRNRAPLHDVPGQAEMLKAISKRYLRIWTAGAVIDTLMLAIAEAKSAPAGPVTLEIPIDVQRLPLNSRGFVSQVAIRQCVPNPGQLDEAAKLIRTAKRPMLWVGGGARLAAEEATELVNRGVGAVTSTNGRAIIPEGHPHSLGAFNNAPEAIEIYERCDLMLVVGSRLRGNETLNNRMVLPRIIQIDVDPAQAGRNYPIEQFVAGDAQMALRGLLHRLPTKLDTDPRFLQDIYLARAKAEAILRNGLGPYCTIADALNARIQENNHPFVRDVTLANATFGAKYVRLGAPHLGVHATAGGIGQGIAMGIGASLSGAAAKTIALIGDGGAQLMLGEFATAVEADAPLVFILMNDRGYGVIRNIQDAHYGRRRAYADLLTPDFSLVCASIGMRHEIVSRTDHFDEALARCLDTRGPALIEVDMTACGPFAQSFAGSPTVPAAAARE